MKPATRVYMLAILICSAAFAVGRARAEAAPSCISPTSIRFRHGTTSATVSGTVERADYACYTLSARAGQHLDALVRSAEQNVVLIAYKPGYAVRQGADGPDVSGATLAGAGEQDEATAVHSTLDRTGTYTPRATVR